MPDLSGVIMLLDEPSMGLAPVIVQEVFRILRRLKQEGLPMLLVEQFAKAGADRRSGLAESGLQSESGRLRRRHAYELQAVAVLIASLLGVELAVGPRAGPPPPLHAPVPICSLSVPIRCFNHGCKSR